MARKLLSRPTFAENLVVRILFVVQMLRVQEIHLHGLVCEGEQTHGATTGLEILVQICRRLEIAFEET